MGKYSFYELKKRSRGEKLPLDINEPAENLCKTVGDSDALKALDEGKEKRLHQDVSCYGKNKDGQQILVAVFRQHYGIVQNYRMIKYRDNGLPLYDRNVINIKVDMKKPKE